MILIERGQTKSKGTRVRHCRSLQRRADARTLRFFKIKPSKTKQQLPHCFPDANKTLQIPESLGKRNARRVSICVERWEVKTLPNSTFIKHSQRRRRTWHFGSVIVGRRLPKSLSIAPEEYRAHL